MDELSARSMGTLTHLQYLAEVGSGWMMLEGREEAMIPRVIYLVIHLFYLHNCLDLRPAMTASVAVSDVNHA